MAARPSAPPSPQARRQAQLQALQAALAARDAISMQRLMGQWVHRHGVSSLDALATELFAAEPEGWAWWQNAAQQSVPVQSSPPEPIHVDPVSAPVPQSKVQTLAPLRRIEPQLPRATRPAPAPSHPALVQLRSWLPDQESRRAA